MTPTAQEKADHGVGTTWTSALVDWSNNPAPHPPSDITEENFGTVPRSGLKSPTTRRLAAAARSRPGARYNEDPNNNPFDSMATRISRGLSSKCPNPYFGVYSNDGRAMCLMEEKARRLLSVQEALRLPRRRAVPDGMGRCAFDRSMTGLNPGAPGFPDNTVYQRLRFINNGLVICMEPQGHAILAPNHTYASQLFQPSPPPSPAQPEMCHNDDSQFPDGRFGPPDVQEEEDRGLPGINYNQPVPITNEWEVHFHDVLRIAS